MSNIVEDDTKVNDPVDDVEEYSAPIIKTLNNRYTCGIYFVACFSETYVFTMSFPFSFAHEQIDINVIR